MKKIVLTLTAAMIFAWQGMSFASSSVDALIQKLEDKGILTDKEANQIKGEIASKEKTSTEATFKNLQPDWLNSMKLTGDFRLRDQYERRDAVAGNPASSHLGRNRGRFRARLNVEDQVNDKMKVIFGIATNGEKSGFPGNDRSNNITFGGNAGTEGSFNKPNIVVNKAYAIYTPSSWATLMGGKMDNPIWEPASLLWDPDITPEGGAVQFQKKLNDYFTPFSTNALFVLKDASPSKVVSTSTFKTNPYMFISQEGVKGNLTEKVYYKAAGTFYSVSNPGHIILDNSNSTNSQSTTLAGTYDTNFNLIGGAVDFGMNDPFGDAAWMIGGYMGSSAINGFGTWKIQSYFKVLQRDSWLDALPDDDFYSGNTNTKGWRTQLDIGLAKNVWFTMAYFRTNIFKYYGATGTTYSGSGPENLFQMDLNFKF